MGLLKERVRVWGMLSHPRPGRPDGDGFGGRWSSLHCRRCGRGGFDPDTGRPRRHRGHGWAGRGDSKNPNLTRQSGGCGRSPSHAEDDGGTVAARTLSPPAAIYTPTDRPTSVPCELLLEKQCKGASGSTPPLLREYARLTLLARAPAAGLLSLLVFGE